MDNDQPPGDANGDLAKKQQPNGDAKQNGTQMQGNGHAPSEKEEPADAEKSGPETKSGGKDKQPEGGFDATKIPRREPGYSLRITFHRATNLPMADYTSLSSDPFIIAQIDTELPTRHKEDPPFRFRTPTVRRSTDPEWNCEWIVANIPATGFRMKCRLYDEDPADHDDRLGNAYINVDQLSDNWPGIRNQGYEIKKRSGSKRAYLVRMFAACIRTAKHLDGELFVSVEMLGRTETDNGGRAYTLGPIWYTKHYSPMLGRIAGRKEPDENAKKPESKAERYNFQANQFQLRGPVPEQLYHRFVEFKPWVKLMFTVKGLSGWLLSKALHHQHSRVYNFSRTTEYGTLGETPSRESTLKFLDLVHFDKGGRIFTYVLTLDGLFRFTETGKEFGIDLLSKHTMHSDVAVYIAFSGEFFIRRLARKAPPSPPAAASSSEPQHPPEPLPHGPPRDEPPSDEPSHYELVIDNDSGTYRPNAALLPVLKAFLAANFPGLHILTLDCQADAEQQQRMKREQRERKRAEGDARVYRQAGAARSGSAAGSGPGPGSAASSISSSDVSDLERMARRQERAERDAEAAAEDEEPGVAKILGHDVKARGTLRKQRWKGLAKGCPSGDAAPSGSAARPADAKTLPEAGGTQGAGGA